MASLSRLPSELLHSIFLFLSPHDLLRIQRVCRQWQTSVSKSVALQEALFLRPEPPKVYWKYTFLHGEPEGCGMSDPSSISSLAANSTRDFHTPATDPPMYPRDRRESFTKARLGTEPFAPWQMRAAMYGEPVIDNREFMQRRCIIGVHNPLLFNLNSSFSIWDVMRESGSSFLYFTPCWASGKTCSLMLLTQPPAVRLTYMWTFTRSGRDHVSCSGDITSNVSLTVADIVREVESLEAALHRSIAWQESYVVVEGPLCPSDEQMREFERDMDQDDFRVT